MTDVNLTKTKENVLRVTLINASAVWSDIDNCVSR